MMVNKSRCTDLYDVICSRGFDGPNGNGKT